VSLKIRLSRVGAKKQASYRIVVAESTAPRDGKAIAILGHYNPLTDPYTLKVDEERTVRWLNNGAQPSETARGLLAKAGVMAVYESSRRQPKKAAGEAAEETRTRRAARAKRTEPPRLVRPTRKEGAESAAAERPARATATAAKKGAAKPAAKKSASGKARAAAKPSSSRTRSKAAAEK